MKANNQPVIGIFGSRNDPKTMQCIRINYMTSISAAGGIPLLMPMYASREEYARLADMLDGFLFAGGDDIHPSRYGEIILPECGAIDIERDESEMIAFPEVYKTGKPILGICRGIQTLCVATGGTLIQDIPSATGTRIAHQQKAPGSEMTHYVSLDRSSLLYSITGIDRYKVNSFHHQAVKTTSLQVSGHSEDGIIEVIEDRSHPFLIGVQWHPEYMSVSDEPSRRLFAAFVDACRKQ